MNRVKTTSKPTHFTTSKPTLSKPRSLKTKTTPKRHNSQKKPQPQQSTTNSTPDGSNDSFTPLKPKLDYKFIKERHEEIEHSMVTRNYNAEIMPQVLSLITTRDSLQQTVQQFRTYRNFLADATAALTNKKISKKPVLNLSQDYVSFKINFTEDMDLKALLDESKRIKGEMAQSETDLTIAEESLEKLALKLPNTTHPDVPVGEEANATVLAHVNNDKGSLAHYKTQGFVPRSHLDIVKELNLVDFEAAGQVSGSRFYYLKGSAALLEMALINFGLSKLIKKGFTPVLPPDMARLAVIEGAGFQSKDEKTLDSQVYRIEGSDLTMCGTAEIPLAGLYMNQIIPEDQLPIKMVAYNHCFRPEVGGYGVSSRGLYRVHQFSKVEMFVISTPEQSDAIHTELIDIEKELFTELGLNFKVLDMPTGDLGAPAYRKIDMEASMPGRAINMYQAGTPAAPLAQSHETIDQIGENYGEISSTSNCTDYQARRLNIRYKPNTTGGKNADESGHFVPPILIDEGKGKTGPTTRFTHTLNGTACAVPRLIVSIIEQFQQPDGRVKIPTALQPFMLGGPQEYL